MSRHPQIEEIEDSDDAFSDPSEDDIDELLGSEVIRQRAPAKATPAPAQNQQQQQQQPTLAQLQALAAAQQQQGGTPMREAPEGYLAFPALYPVYFDKDRSRAEGRRVGTALAVTNPLARTIVEACAFLGLPSVFEPHKTHPKDWANPGRVRVNLNAPGAGTAVKNKHHLYVLVSKYLGAHPTTEHSAGLREHIRGLPPPPADEKWPRPAVPRGWKLPVLVPSNSPAMSGGGVSDNLFEDVMKGMQGMQGMPGMQGLQGMQQALASMQGGAAPAPEAIEPKKAKKGKK